MSSALSAGCCEATSNDWAMFLLEGGPEVLVGLRSWWASACTSRNSFARNVGIMHLKILEALQLKTEEN